MSAPDERPGGDGAGSDPDGDPRFGGSRPEVVVALDVPDATAALSLVEALPGGTWLKVGMELFTAEGPGLVRRLGERGHPVFLDLKLHDIPNTVAGAVRSAGRLGVRLLTVHAAGGRAMLEAAVGAAAEVRSAGGGPGLILLAVTVLTSLDREGLEEVTGAPSSVREAVIRRARLARGAGVSGMVASVDECRELKETLGADLAVATPGIRLPGGAVHDQQRVATPREAAEAGADYLVVGRAVREAADPADALERIRQPLRQIQR